MKLKNILYSMMMGTAVLTGTTSCVSDLDQYPHTETTSKDVYTSLANYEAVLGKIYAAMVTSGQGKGGDNKDMESVLNGFHNIYNQYRYLLFLLHTSHPCLLL